MNRLTEPLRAEHRELRYQIDEILALAQELDLRAPETLADRLARVAAFLQHDLLRHASAEEAALYPAVGRLMGATEATATMSRDHREIEALSERLDRLVGHVQAGTPDAAALQGILYGIHAIVALHFAKEEEVYLPLLDARLTSEDAARLFTDLEAAARTAA